MAEKRKKFSLVKAFTKAVLGVCTLAVLAYGGLFGAFYAGRGERLTPNERQAVVDIFGDQVNPDKIRKHYKDEGHITHIFRRARGTVPPPFSHIDFFGPWARQADFTQASRSQYGFFMHEVTHTWQGQNLNFSFRQFRQYDYEYMLTANSRWRDFGTEQQAEIIEAYAERWIHPEGRKLARTEMDQFRLNVVEAQFPAARATRERLDREDAARTPPKNAPPPAPVAATNAPKNHA